MTTPYHIPVLLEESINGLNIRPEGVYVDATFGGGGHAHKIFGQLTSGKLLAFDRDFDAIPEWSDERFYFANHNYSFLLNFLRYYGLEQVDGILADLGISSHHIDEQQRGFAFRFDAPLDMRMNQQQNITAKHIINEYNEEKLSFILKEYGEISSAFKVAKAIVQKRNISTINTTSELVSVLQSFTPPKFANKFYAQVFQALRIEVNEELESLKQFLISTSKALKPGGRLVIITYHSLEDRLVKNFFKNGDFSDDDTADFIYGTKKSVFSLINKKVITPSEPEIKLNSRARSAKLRIAEKL